MRYAVIGTGAMGGLFGGMLAHAGFDVHFLFRSDYNDVKEKGFTVNSILGNFTLKNVNAYNSTEDMPQCDVILVCIKTIYEDKIPALIKPILKPDSFVILIQNGINMEKFIGEQLPDSIGMAGGMVMASVTKTAPGEITHTNFGTITVGLYRGNDDILKTFCNDINTTGLKAGVSKIEEFVASAKKYLGGLLPKITLGDGMGTAELSLGVDFKDKQFSVDEILDLPQNIAKERHKRVVVCIDEFQNICEFDNTLDFQKKLRSHWQKHTSVCYCLYGSKRHMLLDIFGNYSNPFYKFGDIKFLEKIDEENWVEFITETFARTGKTISEDTALELVLLVDLHPYYVQQLAQQSWLRTNDVCTYEIVKDAFDGIIGQLNLLFCNLIDSLTAKQINFINAINNGEINFSSEAVLKRYNLGTSANIKNLKDSCLKKDIIDILPSKKIVLQDPIFAYWLKQQR